MIRFLFKQDVVVRYTLDVLLREIKADVFGLILVGSIWLNFTGAT